jgi:hypothetical protein
MTQIADQSLSSSFRPQLPLPILYGAGFPLEGIVALGSGQRYDVFVSYLHADNEIPVGTSAKYGWVTGPNVYKKKLFIDHQLKPGDALSDELVEVVDEQRAAGAAALTELHRFQVVRYGAGAFHRGTC